MEEMAQGPWRRFRGIIVFKQIRESNGIRTKGPKSLEKVKEVNVNCRQII